jgi:heme-degrading monooxygenase HmoA
VRYWRGSTAPENADAYEAYLRARLFPKLVRIRGFHGASVLRRDVAQGVEFVTLTQFESLDAVRAFAGTDYERAVIGAEARRLLNDADDLARHYEVVAATS